jgi:hypothetical protein
MEHIKEYAEYASLKLEEPVEDVNVDSSHDECTELDIRNTDNIGSDTFMEHLLQAVFILNEDSKLDVLTADKMREYTIKQAYSIIRVYNIEDYKFSDKYVDIVIDTKTGNFFGRVQMKEQQKEERPSMMNRFKSMFGSKKVEVEDINTEVKTYCDIVILIDQLEGFIRSM